MQPFRFPFRSRALALLGLLVLVLGILGGMIWRNLQRLERIHGYVAYSHEVESVAVDLQELLTDSLTGAKPLSEQTVAQVQRRLSQLDSHLSRKTPEQIAQVQTLLSGLKIQPEAGSVTENRIALLSALGAMGHILDNETEKRDHKLQRLRQGTQTELYLALATLAAILSLAGWFLYKRILTPLNDLKQLLANLAEGDFRPITTHHLDPLLEPVFHSYNIMVVHLAELEESQRRHARSLQEEVHAATHALLEQQRSLARAERLAAVGEVAAELAHELRNPLAGIQVACTNLRRELDDARQAERMDVIVGELKRMARLLNGLLEQSRHTPAPPGDFDAAQLLGELSTLLRYQIPTHVALTLDAPASLPVRLIESGLRQCVLNLLLNAAEALGDTPGSVHIVLQTQNADLLLTVDDDGPGFVTELLEHGVRAFRTTRPDGTGLGLVVVQRYVQEQGGQLRLSNLEPHGARVALRLPGVVLAG
ncbi:MAG: HAMP domain-containing protein [Methylococcaceae bacterium]|nr:MAG: HAMP domain-containing protein [Methylococcaceae bacterium]